MTDIKVKVKTTTEDVLELFDDLDEETKTAVLDQYTVTEIIDSIEKHLKGDGEYWSWDSNGNRFGAQVREAIAKMNGIEDELRRDHGLKVSMLEGKVKDYERYYKWYWKVYHHDEGRMRQYVLRHVGDVAEREPLIEG